MSVLFNRAKNRKLKRLGRPGKIHYHVFHQAWNAYLRLVDINYKESFTCSKCKDSPDIVIFYGITLGTVKDIPPFSIQIDEDQQILPTSQETRLFIPSITKRKAIIQYLQHGLSISAFHILIQSLGISSLENYIKAGSIIGDSNVLVKDSHISDVIKYFARNEPISGIFQFALLDKEELISVVKLSRGRFVQEVLIIHNFRKVYTLEKLFLSFECSKETNIQGQVLMSLHPKVVPLLSWVMERLEALYSAPTRKLVPFKPTESLNFSYHFPGFTTQYK